MKTGWFPMARGTIPLPLTHGVLWLNKGTPPPNYALGSCIVLARACRGTMLKQPAGTAGLLSREMPRPSPALGSCIVLVRACRRTTLKPSAGTAGLLSREMLQPNSN